MSCHVQIRCTVYDLTLMSGRGEDWGFALPARTDGCQASDCRVRWPLSFVSMKPLDIFAEILQCVLATIVATNLDILYEMTGWLVAENQVVLTRCCDKSGFNKTSYKFRLQNTTRVSRWYFKVCEHKTTGFFCRDLKTFSSLDCLNRLGICSWRPGDYNKVLGQYTAVFVVR